MDANDIKLFVKECEDVLKTGEATEHSYRPAFKTLFAKNENVIPVNEPKQSENGKPDFIFKKSSNPSIVIGHAEMKEPGKDLDAVENTDQWERYKQYSEIFLTDGFEWRFYKNGIEYTRIVIVEYSDKTKSVKAKTEYFEALANQLNYFFENSTEKITNGRKLAEIMGNRARLIRDILLRNVKNDQIIIEDINGIYNMFKELLVSDLTIASFSDMYAQTLIYGLFIARFNDSSPDTFDRREARDLIPSTNPLLRDFFDHIAGANFAENLQHLVDGLCEIFRVTDIKKIVEKHVNNDENDYRDPIIHFYEDFLYSYDPNLKNDMGAYYTPTPVVKFIIKSVDYCLKNYFNIKEGIACSDTTTYTRDVSEGYKKGKGTGNKTYFEEKVEIPKVQILDPAVGTATFLNEVIRYIYKTRFINQKGAWNDYVNSNLIPRLNGFEIMMTPYTIAHLKLGMTLQSMNANITKDNRLRIFLTNTLTEGIKNDLPLLSLIGLTKAVTKESEMAAEVKNDYPVMAIIGNPPYNISSHNKSKYILDLIKDYKSGLNETKVNLDDDYIKFIRFSENMIEKNGRGIVAFITNQSYLDGLTQRQMRKHLLTTFNDIYIINLNGDARQNRNASDNDENIFNIRQGVAIAIFVKSKTTNKLAQIHYKSIRGSKAEKFAMLKANDLETIDFDVFIPNEPFYSFSTNIESVESNGHIPLKELFITQVNGIQTGRDPLTIRDSKRDMEDLLKRFIELDPESARDELFIGNDGRDWRVEWAQNDVRTSINSNGVVTPILYRPFDVKWTYYSGPRGKGFLQCPRGTTMQNMVNRDNLALIIGRQGQAVGDIEWCLSYIAKNMPVDLNVFYRGGGMVFPLYLYEDACGVIKRSPNINSECAKRFAEAIGKEYMEESDSNDVVTPYSLICYIYAILYSSTFHKNYAEQLKIDFPPIPIPTESEFERLVPLGEKLIKLHTDEIDVTTNVGFPEAGTCVVEKMEYVPNTNRLYINGTQYFDNIPREAWEYYLGGYQPAKKWMKDRKGMKLSYKEIAHYESMIANILETIKTVNEIG